MPVKDRMAIFTDSERRDYDVNVLDVLEEEGKFVSCRVLTREGVIVMVKDIRFLREFSNDENNKSRFDETEDEGFVSIREDMRERERRHDGGKRQRNDSDSIHRSSVPKEEKTSRSTRYGSHKSDTSICLVVW